MPTDLLRLTGEVEIQAAGGDQAKAPRVSINAYGGDAISPPGWGPTVIDLAGLDVSHPVQILAEHRDTIDGLLGTGTATKTKTDVRVDGALTRANPLTERIVAMAKDGVQFSASVGVQPLERQFIQEGNALSANGRSITAPRGGLTYIKRGILKETSLVALGADAGASVSIAASQSKGNRMSTNSDPLSPENVSRVNAELQAALPENQPGLTQLERVSARWNREKWHNPTGGARQQAERAMMACAAGQIDYPTFERELLEARLRDTEHAMLRSELPQAPAIHGSARDAGGPDMLQAALLCHLGAEDVAARAFGDRTVQTARDARMTSLVEILQAAFHVNGAEPPRGRQDLIKAAFSTASIANIVSNVQQKILLDQWARLPLTCLQLCRKVSASNFREGKAVRLVGRSAMLDELGAGGEIKHGSLEDSAATYQIGTYARTYAVTRQDIINDNLGALDELPRIIARAAGLKMESVFWTLVLANTDNFFHADNDNLTDAALDLTGLGAAVTLMRNLTDADGEPILSEPKTLVVPPALEATADSLYASTNVTMAGTGAAVTTAPSASPFAGKYRPLCVPYISNANYTGNSTLQWYLFADVNVGPAAFLAAFLDGIQNPTVEQADTDFNTLGVQYRGYLDFGFAQCDPQGAVKSSGDG